MTKFGDYQAWKLKKLSNPTFAAHYLNEIEKSSPELVLVAIQNVVRAREVSTVAKEAGVARENIYRAFSEQGNPTVATFREVLKAVGVKIHFEPIVVDHAASLLPLEPTVTGLTSAEPSQPGKSDLLNSFGGVSQFGYLSFDTNSSQLQSGIGQPKKANRSEYGRVQEFSWQPAAG
jgi:probable addiction module antidote protein